MLKLCNYLINPMHINFVIKHSLFNIQLFFVILILINLNILKKNYIVCLLQINTF